MKDKDRGHWVLWKYKAEDIEVFENRKTKDIEVFESVKDRRHWSLIKCKREKTLKSYKS